MDLPWRPSDWSTRPKSTRDGFPKAIRQVPNVVSLKSIFLDIDVKDDAYKSCHR